MAIILDDVGNSIWQSRRLPKGTNMEGLFRDGKRGKKCGKQGFVLISLKV